MSENFEPSQPKSNPLEDVRTRVEEALDTPEVKAAVSQGKSFYAENKKIIHGVLIGIVVLRVYKRKVAKATAKAVLATLEKDFDEKMPQMIDTVVEAGNYIPVEAAMEKASKAFYEGWYTALNTPAAIAEAMTNNKVLEASVDYFAKKFNETN